jgi:hypothetical protein
MVGVGRLWSAKPAAATRKAASGPKLAASVRRPVATVAAGNPAISKPTNQSHALRPVDDLISAFHGLQFSERAALANPALKQLQSELQIRDEASVKASAPQQLWELPGKTFDPRLVLHCFAARLYPCRPLLLHCCAGCVWGDGAVRGGFQRNCGCESWLTRTLASTSGLSKRFEPRNTLS